jgi:hypothetical protein
MNKHIVNALLILLGIVGIASAQQDLAYQSNAGYGFFGQEHVVSLTDQQPNVLPVNYQFGCASGCCDQAGCAGAGGNANGCNSVMPRGTDCGRFVPNMIGDSFGVPRVYSTPTPGTFLNFPTHITKAADNNNVRPYDRLSFTYNRYQDVPTTFDPTGAVLTQNDISEYRIFGEKKVLDGLGSLNIVVPVYDTVSFQQTGASIATGTEFGNLAFGGKLLLIDRATIAVSTGLQVEAPTSRDSGFPTVGQVTDNQSWYLTPYLASLYTPNDNFFMQSFLSYRARTGSDPVSLGGTVVGNTYQQNLLLADVAAGYWMLRGNGRGITGIAPVVEMHYSTTTEDDNPLTISNFYYGRRDLLNATLGTHIEFNQRHVLSLGYVLPLRDKPLPGGMSTDRAFDGEFSVQFNMYR